jgi:2,4-dienoyl-CoA reductase-like NADH-dependent reductase (Old Yellow Enzyme family)
MSELFEKTSIKTLELKNRFIRSATWSGVADQKGWITDRALELYGNLAAGRVGLIITGFQYVMPNAVAMKYQVGNYSEGLLPGLSRWVQAIHAGGAKVMAQLVHTGSKANPELFWEEGEVWGPSAVLDPLTGRIPKEMTLQEISQVVEAFAEAALRSKRAGFDGIQLHGAHGYGINQFLSGLSNQRTDGYGGSISNRYRFLGEIMAAVRKAVGNEYPVFIKLSGHDYVEGGLSPEESLYVGRRLVDDGIDCIEVSAGSRASADGMVPSRTKIRKEDDEAYLAKLAQYFKQALDVPIITVGGIRSPSVAARILSQGLADFVALCRPFIREPHLINRWMNGDLEKATCISCNGCFETALEGLGVTCKVDRDLKKRKQ